MKKFGWFCIFLFLFFPFFSYGDGVGWGSNGHNLCPINNDSIKLVSELLKMQQNGRNVKTNCWYLLKNITNNPQDLTIGFYIDKREQSYFLKVSDLKVYVDGKAFTYEKKIFENDYYGAWNMSFLPNENKMVYVEQILRWFGGHSFEQNILCTAYNNFSYKLHLAKKWAGKPERIEVYYDFGDGFSMKDTLWGVSKSIRIEPEGFKLVNDRKLEWLFENTDSIDDITINIDIFYEIPDMKSVLSKLPSEHSYQLDKTNKKLLTENDMKCWENIPVKKLKEIKNRYEVYKIALKYYPAFLRNSIYAKHGYIFKKELWSNMFLDCKWYYPRDDFSESDFNYYERNNIEFIIEYEKTIDEYLKTLE